MTHDYTPQLPDVFPQDKILVEDETHTYQTYEGSSGSVLEETEYTLNKAPVDEITEVTGIYNTQAITFTNGVDYSLDDLVRDHTNKFTFFDDDGPYKLDDEPDTGSTVVTDESGDSYTEGTDYDIVNTDGIEEDTLEWLDGGSTPDNGEKFTVTFEVTFADSIIKWDTNERTPDAGSKFYTSYRCNSVISRYIDGAEEQFESIEDELESIIEGKFVESATGQELDELGRLFGVLGKRSGRNDTQYRIYLKSVVQSFISRGTVNGIKLAISAATDVPIEDITINEDFENNEYQVEIIPNTPITGSLLEQVAEIADPSGVKQSNTLFTLDPERVTIDDTVSLSKGQLVADAIQIDDTAATFNNDNFEDVVVDDANEINANKYSAPKEEAASDDNIQNIETDSAYAQEWENDGDPSVTTEWNFFQWTEVSTIIRSNNEDVSISDALVIDANKFTISDESGVTDANTVNANVTTVNDAASTDDAVTVTFNQSLVAEDVGSADAVNNVSTQSVAWDQANWDESGFDWTAEFN